MEMKVINGKLLYRYDKDVVNCWLSNDFWEIKKKKTGKVYKINKSIIALDTEAYTHSEDVAITYLWTVFINGAVFYGRTVDELADFFTQLSQINHDFYIFIHSLHYDMYYIDDAVDGFVVNVAREKYKPLEATWKNIKFRCTHALSNVKLEELAETYGLTHRKLSMDYLTPRTPYTALTDEELEYAMNDVILVGEYIYKLITALDDINFRELPRTYTKLCGKKYSDFVKDNVGYYTYTKHGDRNKKVNITYVHKWYRARQQNLTTETGREVHDAIKKATTGAFIWCDNTMNGMTLLATDNLIFPSADIHSDFPSQMLMHKYSHQMNKSFEIKTVKQFLRRTTNDYGIATFKVPFMELKERGFPILTTTQTKDGDSKEINGIKVPVIAHNVATAGKKSNRIVAGYDVIFTVNSVEYETIKMCYDFDESKVEISDVFIGRDTNYLPPWTIQFLVKSYKDKTLTPDGIAHELAKVGLNGITGKAQMDITKPFYDYSGDWEQKAQSYEEASIRRYQNEKGNKAEYILYQWGSFIQSHARQAIIKLDIALSEICDVFYNDTDGLKAMVRRENYARFKEILAEYNAEVRKNLENMCSWISQRTGGEVNLTIDDLSPNGKLIGTIAIEAEYTAIKYLASKTYLTCETEIIDNKPYHKLTIKTSGVNKEKVKRVILDGITPDYTTTVGDVTYVHYSESDLLEIFDNFSDGAIIPDGKMCHNLTQAQEVTVTDYLGDTYTFNTTKGLAIYSADRQLTTNCTDGFKAEIKCSAKPTVN